MKTTFKMAALVVTLGLPWFANESWAQHERDHDAAECGKCPPDYDRPGQALRLKILQSFRAQELKSAQGNSGATRALAAAAAASTASAPYQKCPDNQGKCDYTVTVTEGTGELAGECVADMGYCGLCATEKNKVMTWTIAASGTPASASYVFSKKHGIRLFKPKSKKSTGSQLTHFDPPNWVSDTKFQWTVGIHKTWGPVKEPKDHGHVPEIVELVDGHVSRICKLYDPPIINTAN